MANDDPPAAAGTAPASPEAPAGTAGLDFDKAAYAEPVATKLCAACKQGIANEYYEITGHVVCSPCRDRIVGATPDRWAFWRALLYGGLTGAACATVWSLIIQLTGSEWGIIAIVVGIAMGIAVRKGSRGRGGWRYQLLAMGLTYVAITASYVPMAVKAMLRVAGEASHVTAVERKPDSPPATSEAALPKAPPARSGPPAAPNLALLFVVAWCLALAAPFLGGTSNIIGIIIIAVALYEAWKYNRAVKVSGPFRLAAAAPAGAPAP